MCFVFTFFRSATQAVDDSLSRVGLSSAAGRLAGACSGGMQRRLSVAIALLGNVSVVYLDEPSTGLDPASRQLLWKVVRGARSRCAVMLTTHSMEEAEALCDGLAIFVAGRMACIGTTQVRVIEGPLEQSSGLCCA